MELSEEQVLETQQLLRVLEKAHKTLRLYQTENEVCRRLEAELSEAVVTALERWGEIDLAITEHSMLLGDELVYEATERTDSLAFLFHRDGIRRLSLLPGLDRDEVHGFLTALNHVSVVANEADDLVTIFWERDFKFINYFAVEELSETSRGPSIEEQVAKGSLGGEGAAVAPESVSLEDISRPVSRLPVRECVLTEEEVDDLQGELDAEERRDPAQTVVDLAAELVLLEGTAEERTAISKTLIEAVQRVLEDGPAARVVGLVDRLQGVLEKVDVDNRIADSLVSPVQAALAETARVRRLLEMVDGESKGIAADELTAFLVGLGVHALPGIISTMGELDRAPLRRAAAEAVVAYGRSGAEALCGHLASAEAPDSELLGEMLYVARHLGGGEGMPVISRMLELDDPELRRQAAKALGPYQDGPVGRTWIELLSDDDAEMRGLALTALLRGGTPELAQPIAEHTMRADFEHYSIDEKKRSYAAVARLAGETSLAWFAELLERPHRRHFPRRGEKELIVAAIHGMTKVKGERARAALEELMSSDDRHIRLAIRKVMKEMNDGG